MPFRWSVINDDQIQGIDQVDQVKRLSLLYAPITGSALESISGMESLERLNIHGTKVRSGVLFLERCRSLRSLGHSETICDDEAFDQRRFNLLAKLGSGGIGGRASRSELLSLNNINQTQGAIHWIEESEGGNRTTIRYHSRDGETKHENRFHLNRVLTPEDFDSLAGLTELTKLELEASRTVSSKEVRRICDARNLQSLVIADATIDADFMNGLAGCPNLQTCSIASANMQAGCFSTMGDTANLTTLEIQSAGWNSTNADRLNALQQAHALKSLTLRGGITDADCRIISQCKNLERLQLAGDFSAKSLTHLSQLPELTYLAMDGLQLANRERELLQLRNPKLTRVRLNPTEAPVHHATLYSETVARVLGIEMAGECSCTCMDVNPPLALNLPGNLARIRDGRLEPTAEMKRHYDRKSPTGGASTKFGCRIRDAVRCSELVIDTSLFSGGDSPLYLSSLDVHRLVLIDNGREVALAGNIGELVVKDHPTSPRIQSRLSMQGVQSLRMESAPRVWKLHLQGDAEAIRLDGSFPKFNYATVISEQLRYLCIPYSGSAPAFQVTQELTALWQLPELRLLKIPATTENDAFWADHCSPDIKPPPLHEIDLRGTDAGDGVLKSLARLKTLRILNISDCPNMTSTGIRNLQTQNPMLRIVQ